jgi:anthranilate synthase component 1
VHIALPGTCDLLWLAAAFPQRYPCLFESAARGGDNARYDILLAHPQDALVQHRGGRVRNARGEDCGNDFLPALDALWRVEHTAASPPGVLPFEGGWALFLSYEMAAQVEPRLRLPAAPDASMPLALALRCPAAIVVDRQSRQTFLVAETGHEQTIRALQADLQSAREFSPLSCVPERIDEDDPARFLQSVARIHEHLRAGDVFQVNLSREWRAHYAQAPRAADLYASLRRANPAPFAGLLQWQDWAIASSSPERLIQVRDGTAQTRPIAGTRPRWPGDDDAARVRELVEHAKERAEHVMLIDLERNDLGRVCVPGSVQVDQMMAVESYAHVHHLVSNVRGRLRHGTTPGQVMSAVFPGGTITGCPKVRCMQIIAQLEGVGRGAYTGALGYLDRNGDMDLNILIRSIALCGGHARLRAGAGIVADSDATHELDETRAKARGLLRALGERA